jgi:DNA replication protein DnaC
MRTKKRWEQVISPKILKVFPLRIHQDLEIIKSPKNIKVQSCYIHGKVSTGKTIHACFMLLQESLNSYLKGEAKVLVFISIPALFELIKLSYSDKKTDSSKLVSFYSTVPFLILDDIGSMKPTEWVLDILYLIINNRYENMLTTVFTSNLDLSELAEKLGDNRITSRIARMGKIIKKEKYK